MIADIGAGLGRQACRSELMLSTRGAALFCSGLPYQNNTGPALLPGSGLLFNDSGSSIF